MGVYPTLFLSRADQAIQSIRERVAPVAQAMAAQTSPPAVSESATSHKTTEQAGIPALPRRVAEKR